MFQSLQPLPPDPILGLSAAYRADTNPSKVDLGVGVYKDANGRTPVMRAVKRRKKFWLPRRTARPMSPPLVLPGTMRSLPVCCWVTRLSNRSPIAGSPYKLPAVAADFALPPSSFVRPIRMQLSG